VRAIADAFADHGVRVALETGQESAMTMLEALADLGRPEVGVNFDPANMILYGMGDPVAALRLLAGRVAQVHIKDAVPSPTPGRWGSERRAGEGAVEWPAFFGVLAESRLDGDLVIEREGGESRVDDVIAARRLIERYQGARR
jgi:sugar phosphate isomerase/epimerase